MCAPLPPFLPTSYPCSAASSPSSLGPSHRLSRLNSRQSSKARLQPPMPKAGTTARSTLCTFSSVKILLSQIPAMIHNLTRLEALTGCAGQVPTLTSPAVLHCLKAILIVCGEARGLPDPGQATIFRDCAELLAISSTLTLTASVSTVSVQDWDANRDADGLPLHTNPFLSKAALETDVRALGVLGMHMQQKGSLMAVCGSAQKSVVFCWTLAGHYHCPGPGAIPCMVKSMVGVAKQCSIQGLQLLLGARGEKPSGLEQHGHGGHQAMRLAEQRAAADLCPSQTAANGLCKTTRSLYFHASHFRIHIAYMKLLPCFGESTTDFLHTHTHTHFDRFILRAQALCCGLLSSTISAVPSSFHWLGWLGRLLC